MAVIVGQFGSGSRLACSLLLATLHFLLLLLFGVFTLRFNLRLLGLILLLDLFEFSLALCHRSLSLHNLVLFVNVVLLLLTFSALSLVNLLLIIQKINELLFPLVLAVTARLLLLILLAPLVPVLRLGVFDLSL